jgi:hypothetical protein
MLNFIRPRWRKPAGMVLAGAVFAAAWAIRGGRHWWLWVTLIAVAAAARAFSLYVWSGEDDDLGALAGSRADERQKLLSLRSRALAFNVTALVAFAGLTAGIALRATWWWPFAVVLGASACGYLFGLSTYGIAADDPAGDAGSHPSPVSG